MRLIGLDFARCVAFVLVLLAHIGQEIDNPIGSFFGIPHFYYVSLGGVAVTIFLILSGTVLELQYGMKAVSPLSFIVKRFLRIYPVYYLSLLLGMMIYFIRFRHDTGSFLAGISNLGISDIVLSIFAGYAFAGRWGGPFVATSWYIALIITMYMLFPFLSRQIEKHPNVSICLLFFISVLSRLIVGNYEFLAMRPLDWFPFCRVFEFSLGIYLAIVMPRISLHYLESSRWLRSSVSFFSQLSFPLFLTHYPLIFIIDYLTNKGFNQLLAIGMFLLVSLFFSWILLFFDNKIPRPFLLERINRLFNQNLNTA